LAINIASVILSDFNDDLTATSVEGSDVLKKPSVEHLTPPQGPQSNPGLNGTSEWYDISNKPMWVASNMGDVNLS
jgi:hypothetical protein